VDGRDDRPGAEVTRPTAGAGLVRAAGWAAVGLVITGTLRFSAKWFSDAMFGKEGLAFVTAAMSIATIAAIPGAVGMSAGVTKLVAEQRVFGRGEATARYAARLGMAAGAVAAVAAGIYALTEPSTKSLGLSGALAVAALTLAFVAYTLGKAVLFGFGGSRRYAAEEAAGAILFGLGCLGAWLTGRVELTAAALVLAYLPVARETLVPARGEAETVDKRTLFGYAAVGGVGSLAGVGFTAVTPLAAGALGGVSGAALVGAVLAVLEPLNLAPRVVSLVILPEISRSEAMSDRAASAASLRLATGLVAAAALPACSVLLLERERILGLMFSSDFVGGATLGWFVMAFLVSVVGAPAVTSLAAAHLRTATVSMAASLVGFGAAIALWAAMGPKWAVTAIGFGYFIGSVIQVSVPIAVAWRRFEVSWLGQWLRIAAAAAVVGLLATRPPSIGLDALAVAVAGAALAPELGALLLSRRRKA